MSLLDAQPSQLLSCVVSSNPDIEGIGVRLAIYIPAVVAVFHSGIVAYHQAKHGLEVLSTQTLLVDEPTRIANYVDFFTKHPQYTESINGFEFTLFLTGASLIISAFASSHINTISPYDAIMVLNLALITSIAGIRLLEFRELRTRVKIAHKYNLSLEQVRDLDSNNWISWYKLAADYPLLIQLAFVVAFGLRFWASLLFSHSFGGYRTSESALSDSSECITKTSYWVFWTVPSIETSLPFQRFSFFVYTAIAAGVVYRVMDTTGLRRSLKFIRYKLDRIFHPSIHMGRLMMDRLSFDPHALDQLVAVPRYREITRLLSFSLTKILPTAFMIVFTEKTISENRKSGAVLPPDSDWSFAQTFALLGAIISVGMYIKELIQPYLEPYFEPWDVNVAGKNISMLSPVPASTNVQSSLSSYSPDRLIPERARTI